MPVETPTDFLEPHERKVLEKILVVPLSATPTDVTGLRGDARLLAMLIGPGNIDRLIRLGHIEKNEVPIVAEVIGKRQSLDCLALLSRVGLNPPSGVSLARGALTALYNLSGITPVSAVALANVEAEVERVSRLPVPTPIGELSAEEERLIRLLRQPETLSGAPDVPAHLVAAILPVLAPFVDSAPVVATMLERDLNRTWKHRERWLSDSQRNVLRLLLKQESDLGGQTAPESEATDQELIELAYAGRVWRHSAGFFRTTEVVEALAHPRSIEVGVRQLPEPRLDALRSLQALCPHGHALNLAFDPAIEDLARQASPGDAPRG